MKSAAVCALVAVMLASGALAVVPATVAAQQAVTQRDVAVRDQLIADQESLLNVYRCLFGIDAEVVPGGCIDGKPSRGPTEAGVFDGTPTQQDVARRDHLVADQEALLNVYRCLFDVDTQVVPGGCVDGRPDSSGVAQPPTVGPVPPEAADVAAPSPVERDVVVREVVGSGGGVVAGGQVRVSVPAGAVTGQAVVEIREPLGYFGVEVGGEVVGVDHQGPVSAAVSVVWDVSRLSVVQQRSLLVVRWDGDLGDWVPGDADFEINGGILSAEIRTWSFWTWAANTGQDAQEFFGRRVEEPKCSGEALHRWVVSVVDPDEDLSAASIRACYENDRDEIVTMRLANNRTFSQFVYRDDQEGWAWVWPGEEEASISWLVQWAAHEALTNSERVFIPPLKEVAVGVARPSSSGGGSIGFRNKNDFGTFVADVVFFAVSHLKVPNIDNKNLQLFLEVVIECGVQQWENLSDTYSTRQLIQTAADAVKACGSEILDPDSEVGKNLRNILSEYYGGSDAAISHIQNSRHLQSMANVLKLLTIAEAVGYFADLGANSEDLAWGILGRKRGNPLGQWTPTCTDVEKDIIMLSNNLTNQDIFSDNRYELHEFDAWEPSAEIAVTPLKQCHPIYRAAFADLFGADWTDQIAADIVLTKIRALDPPTTQPTAPDGPWTAVSAGGGHSCGIRADQTIACWGANHSGQSDAPSGQYTAVSASYGYTCGLRTDGTVECWGASASRSIRRAVDPPKGQFTSISTGFAHACGIRTDKTVECWGENDYSGQTGFTDAPEGLFHQVSVHSEFSCGLRIDTTIQCWTGNPTYGGEPWAAPSGQFTAVSVAVNHSCGLRTDGTIECWGGTNLDEKSAPSGQFSAVLAGGGNSCGLRTDGTIECWGDNRYGKTDAPSGQFSTISIGGHHSCGLRTNGTIECWGDNRYGQLVVPS